MPYLRIVGLQVDDPETYQKYRTAMEPLLLHCGGKFLYDFWIEEVLRNETGKKINRVFMISFPDKKTKEDFFGNEEYKIIREKFYDASVSEVTLITENETA